MEVDGNMIFEPKLSMIETTIVMASTIGSVSDDVVRSNIIMTTAPAHAR